MKAFKPLYYSALVILTLVFAVLSSLQVSGAYVNSGDIAGEIQNKAAGLAQYSRSTLYDTADHNNAVDYIARSLTSYGISNVNAKVLNDEDGKVDTVTGKPDKPSFVRMKTSLSYDEIAALNGEIGSTDKYYGTDVVVNNIIVYFPGTSADGGNILFTAHYDSLKSGKGIVNNLGSVGAMLEAVRSLAVTGSEYKGANGLLFVFTDGAEAGALGAYALKSKFVGFGDAYSSVIAGINFDAMGVKGPLVLYSSGNGASKLASKLVGGSSDAYAYAGSELVAAKDSRVFDSAVYGAEIPYLNFSVIDGRESYNTVLDNIDNFNAKAYVQAYNMINKAVSVLGDVAPSSLAGADTGAFSYLGLNALYGSVKAYVMLGIAVAAMIAVIVINILKKKFCFLRALIGACVQLASLVLALVGVFALYYIVAGLLTLMGFVSGHILTSLAASSIPLVIAAAVISIAFAAMGQHILKPIVKVKAGDVVRGNIFIYFVVACVTSFVAPSVASVVTLVLIGELAVLLAWMLAKDKFRSAAGMDMDRLLLFALPVIIVIPMFAGVLLPVAEVMGAVWYPVVMLMAASLLGFVTPYFNFLTPALDKIAKKLPERTLRIERTVTENIEHKAKKGKFEIKTYRKLVKEKIPRKYTAVFGLSVIIIAGILMSFVSAMSGVSYGYNYRLGVGGNEPAVYYIKDAAGVYGDAPSQEGYVLLIKDPMVYKYFKYELDGYVYNSQLKGYAKSVSAGNVFGLNVTDITTEGNNKQFKVNPDQSDWGLFYDITIPNASGIKSIEITSTDNTGVKQTTSTVISFEGKSKEIVLKNLSGVSTIKVIGMSGVYSGMITIVATANESNIETNMSTFTELSEIKDSASEKGVDVSAGVIVTASASI